MLSHLRTPVTYTFPLLEKRDINDNSKMRTHWPDASRWRFNRQTRLAWKMEVKSNYAILFIFPICSAARLI